MSTSERDPEPRHTGRGSDGSYRYQVGDTWLSSKQPLSSADAMWAARQIREMEAARERDERGGKDGRSR